MKTISVLFTQKHDWFARLLTKLRRHQYSHVSLSLENSSDEFYSFNVKGFVRETIDKFRRHNINKSMLYEIEVKDNVYNNLKEMIEEIKEQRHDMKYSYVGISLCFFNIPFHLKKHYFCSEFVAEMLSASHAVFLRKKSSLYLPEQLREELDQCLSVNKIVNVV